MATPRLLLVSSNPAELDMLSRQVPESQLEVVALSDPEAALDYLEQYPVDVLVVDEEHDDLSGYDILLKSREVETNVATVLIVDEDHRIDLAADAINHVRVAKIILRPFDINEFIEECLDAADQHRNERQQTRRYKLSQVRVQRLNNDVAQSRRALYTATRKIEQLKRQPMFIPSLPPSTAAVANDTLLLEPAPEQVALNSFALVTQFEKLIVQVVEASPDGEAAKRIRELMEYCAAGLDWPESEIERAGVAALLHHALLGAHPNERGTESLNRTCKHARELADMLGDLPGLESVAETIRFHHAPMEAPKGETHSIPRSARLLQILSHFDDILHNPELQSAPEAQSDPDFALNRASDAILRLANDGRLDYDISQFCIRDFIPQKFGRREYCIDVEELRPDMQTTRTVYAEHMVLVRAQTQLTASMIEKLLVAHQKLRMPGIWIDPKSGSFDE